MMNGFKGDNVIGKGIYQGQRGEKQQGGDGECVPGYEGCGQGVFGEDRK